MKKKQIISILLTIALAVSVSGCGNAASKGGESTSQQTAADIVKEEAFTTIPEEKLVTDYMKDNLSGEDMLQDGIDFINLYYFDKSNSGTDKLISKYNLDYVPKATYTGAGLYSKYPKLFQIGITRLFANIHEKKESIDTLVNSKLGTQIVNYLSDAWMNEANDKYSLAPEFKEKNPKEIFQKYLKENKINITDIHYPAIASGFNYVAGANVSTVKVTIKGIQDKKPFEKTLALDFYFVANKDIRTGVHDNDQISDKDFEIMAVSTGTVPADQFNTSFKYDISKAKEKFEIN